jgi:uncharacterized protein YutE (UPF0331/DUF86 family)/predicted nucleotidyltransferase
MKRFDETIKRLEEYFTKKPHIAMVFIFGSYAKEQETSESDIDIAVYFYPETSELEWEETRSYEGEDDIWNEVEKITCIRTDMVVLNRAPSTLAYSILQAGFPIIIKDRSLYLRFYLLISAAAEDFRDLVKDFWRIKNRSRSLTEIDRDRLIRILDFLGSELADYGEFTEIDRKLYLTESATRRNVERWIENIVNSSIDIAKILLASDGRRIPQTYRRNVERWIENIVNSSIDIAKILLASDGRRIPQTYREILQNLSLFRNFNYEAAEKLAGFSKLRNILTHEYVDIRYRQIENFIQNAEMVYKELESFVRTYLKEIEPEGT